MHGFGGKGVNGDSIHSVSGYDDYLTPPNRRTGEAHTGKKLGFNRAVVDKGHVVYIVAVTPDDWPRYGCTTVDLYLFDYDRTLYAYDSRKRLPAQSRLSGVSQYHLAKSWWVAGYERRAESGEWPTSAEYLDKFAEVTGARMTLQEWAEARQEASTPNPGVIAALRRAASLGTVSLMSNNPSPFVESLPLVAPEVVEILGGNLLVSFQIGVRKPDPRAFQLAIDHYGARAEDTFFVDDSAENVAGAASIGITAQHFEVGNPDAVADLDAAIEAFRSRNS